MNEVNSPAERPTSLCVPLDEYKALHRATCGWTSPSAADYDAWQTGCGQEFIFSADGPLENSFKFCPYCGGQLEINGPELTGPK